MTRNHRLYDYFLVLNIFLCFFSHAISTFINAGAQIYLFLSPILLVVTILLYRKIPIINGGSGIAALLLFFTIFSIVSPILSGKLEYLIQVSVFFFTPALSFISGYYLRRGILNNVFIYISLIIGIFTVLERYSFFTNQDFLSITEFSKDLRSFGLDGSVDYLFGRAVGLFGNSNELGYISGALMYAILITGSDSRLRPLKGVAIFLCVLMLLLSSSRGSVISMIISLFLFLVINNRYLLLLRILTYASFFIIIIYLILQFFPSDAAGQFYVRFLFGDNAIEDGNLYARMLFWDNFLTSDYVIFGTFAPPESILGHAIDNLFIRYWAQAGILGLVILIWSFVSLTKLALLVPFRDTKCLSVSFIVFTFLNSQTMLTFLSGGGAVMFWSISGFIAKQATRAETRSDPEG